MRRNVALAGVAIAAATAFAPLPSASASCTDLSWIGGPSCFMVCPKVLLDLTDRYVNEGFLRCTM